MLAHVLHAYSGALSGEKRALQSTMGKKFAFQAPARFGAKGEKLSNNKAESFFPLNFNVYIE